MINVLFDIDETLLSVPPGINAKASSVMFKKVFHVNANEEIIDNVGKTEMGIIQEILRKVRQIKRLPEQELSSFEIPDEAYKIWTQAMAQELKIQPVRVLPGVLQLLTALINNPTVKLTILTGNSPWRSEEKLKSAKLDHFFRDPSNNKLRGAFGNMAEKRDQLFEIVKRQTEPNDRFVMIDDSLLGAKMAQLYKIPMIMVATGKATEDELLAFTPNVFQDFGENRWQEVVRLIEKT